MRNWKLLACLFVMSLIVGCGGGGDPSTRPSVSNLVFSPSAAPAGQFNSFVASCDFIDGGADMLGGFATYQYTDINGVPVTKSTSFSNANITGMSGTVSWTIAVPTAQAASPGSIDYVVYITDNNGNRSNPLNGTFSIN